MPALPLELLASPTPNPFTGEWIFVPLRKSDNSGLYRPEYIELRLTEETGTLRGRYRARYRIPDQAISPTVLFHFEGPTAADSARLPWTGPGGARGDVTLRLLSSRVLEISWVATQIGSELGLISGSATLVRKIE